MKLVFLQNNQSVNLLPSGIPSMVRDIMRNDVAAKNYFFGFASSSGGAVAATTPNVKSVEPFSDFSGVVNYLRVGTLAVAMTVGTGKVLLPFVKLATGFKINTTAKTSDEIAALAYGDSSRTTFPSIQDFIVQLALNADLRAAIETHGGNDIHGVVINQSLGTIVLLTNDYVPTDSALTTVAAFEIENPGSVQFGE
jgi:hypothetical protein